MVNFGPKPWTNSFGKISVFRFFQVLVLYSIERRFFALEYQKIHIPGIDCLQQKKMEKCLILDKNDGLNLNFSTLPTSRFYSIEKRFFALEYHKTNFPGLDCLKKKKWKNGQFCTKPMD